MTMLRNLTLYAFVLILAACGGNDNPVDAETNVDETAEESENQAFDAVMEIHDEVMPKMGEMNRLKRQLEESTVPEDKQEEVQQAITDLEEADEAMMQWMSEIRQLDGLRNEMAHDEIMRYLQEEQEEMEAIRDKMVESIEQATELLAEING